MVNENFWEQWSKNFPLTVTHKPAEYGMPEGIEFTRAGQRIFISKEEFAALAVPAEEAAISKNPAPMLQTLRARLNLDPEPWARFPDKDGGGARFARNSGGFLYWNPRPGYSQNSEDYA